MDVGLLRFRERNLAVGRVRRVVEIDGLAVVVARGHALDGELQHTRNRGGAAEPVYADRDGLDLHAAEIADEIVTDARRGAAALPLTMAVSASRCGPFAA